MLLQDAVATAVAVGAAWLVLRRVVGFVRPQRRSREPACGTCAANTAARHQAGDEQPLVFVKSPRR